MSKLASSQLIHLAAALARCDGVPDDTPDGALSVMKDNAVSLRHITDALVRPMEQENKDLLEVLTAIAGGPVQRVSQDLHNRARAAIAKATGDSHE